MIACLFVIVVVLTTPKILIGLSFFKIEVKHHLLFLLADSTSSVIEVHSISNTLHIQNRDSTMQGNVLLCVSPKVLSLVTCSDMRRTI